MPRVRCLLLSGSVCWSVCGATVSSARMAGVCHRQRCCEQPPLSLWHLSDRAAAAPAPAVVHVKPFGAFLEFGVEVPSFLGGAAQEPGSAGGGQQQQQQRAPLVGLVHRSEVSWDPAVDLADALQACKGGQL